MASKLVVVFVHGWSVTDIDTYGGLPERLRNEATSRGINIQIVDIYLGRYISFHDEVRIQDISLAFQTAVQEQLSDFLEQKIRFACITHSTGGPVIRDWWNHWRKQNPKSPSNGIPCPMSHLIMLAPANYGSALAQLGKSSLSRMKFWFGGVEPGQGVLDWLELGSSDAWTLNRDWILSDGSQIDANGVFPFVLTGQSIDRAFYDNLNNYTGEMGSDGVVRVAAANLAGNYIKLEQEEPTPKPDEPGELLAQQLKDTKFQEAPKTALCVIKGKSHSGKKMGIMTSVENKVRKDKSSETIDAIFACLQVEDKDQYDKVCDKFIKETQAVQKAELLEIEDHTFRSREYFIHDRFSMVIFRVYDDKGYPVKDYDLILTSGDKSNPNHLPRGFFADRQQNKLNPETITYYFNYDVMDGAKEIKDDAKIVRDEIAGAETLGIKLIPRPAKGFIRYLSCEIEAKAELLKKVLKPNATTLVDICLRRVVSNNIFSLVTMPVQNDLKDFKNINP